MPSHLKRYDEPGDIHFWTISCYHRLGFFHHDDIKQVAVDALRLLQTRFGICLVGYVVMPEHVHVVLFPHPRGSDEPIKVSRLLNVFKQHVGYHGKEKLRDCWQEHGQLWSAPLNAWAHGKLGDRVFWNTRGYDSNISTRDPLIETLNYCHTNPVTRGLVDHPDQWKWSSFRFYELADASVLGMDWDTRWPLIW